jgi:hypothetical protein
MSEVQATGGVIAAVVEADAVEPSSSVAVSVTD